MLAKVIELDPRGACSLVLGVAERPKRIAQELLRPSHTMLHEPNQGEKRS